MRDQPPLVSILMPVYQAERWLPEALESVFAQTFADFELIAVDDGSTDGSAAILEDWSRRDPRMRVVSAPHGGLPRTREISLQEAQGRFAAFLDADDRWLPHRLERQLPYADDRTIVFSDTLMADEAGEVFGTYKELVIPPPPVEWPAKGIFSELLQGCFIPLLTVLAPVQLLKDGGSFRRAERAGFGSTGGQCDFEMWLALALGGAQFHYIDGLVSVYRTRSDSLSADLVQNCIEGLRVFKGLERDVREEADARLLKAASSRLQKQVEVAHRKRAWSLILRDRRRDARVELWESLRARPTGPRAWVALVLFHIPPVARRMAVRGTAGG